jgi:hypothetical protein
MPNKRLLIASPAKGGLPLHYLTLVEQCIRQGVPGWDIDWLSEGSNHILAMARNILASSAMAHGYDRMLMLDTDHPINLTHLSRILSHDHETIDAVSGLYCLKKPGKPFFLGVRMPGAEPDENRLLPAAFVPTGFLSVSTKALRQMCDDAPESEFYVPDEESLPPTPGRTNGTMFELFPVGVNGPRTAGARLRVIRQILSENLSATEKLTQIDDAIFARHEPGFLTGEDYGWAWRARRAGVKLYLDTACVVPHRGNIDFPITNPDVVATACDPIPEPEGRIDNW